VRQDQAAAERRQGRLERDQVGRRIIDDQDVMSDGSSSAVVAGVGRLSCAITAGAARDGEEGRCSLRRRRAEASAVHARRRAVPRS